MEAHQVEECRAASTVAALPAPRSWPARQIAPAHEAEAALGQAAALAPASILVEEAAEYLQALSWGEESAPLRPSLAGIPTGPAPSRAEPERR
ncbi:MAG TPA: hypothetical protein VFH26_04485, partial [Gemmatimonadales bacterium]|nr:hypothetical protein [Gemmatimonadales bacterium]